MQKFTEDEVEFDLALIDADSLIYQIAFVEPALSQCKINFDNKLKEIMTSTGASDGIVFLKGKDNFRYKVDIAYKANRKDTIEPEIQERIVSLYEYANGFSVQSEYGEADDYCNIYAQEAIRDNKNFVISHIDKDLNTIAGWHHNFRNDIISFVNEDAAYQFLMEQLLTGDSTDNIQGLKGVGPITAKKLLKDIPNNLLLDRVISIWKDKKQDSWENDFLKCANCIYLRKTTEDLQPFSFEELKEQLLWKTMDTGTLSQTDQTMPSDSSTMLKTSNQVADTSAESN